MKATREAQTEFNRQHREIIKRRRRRRALASVGFAAAGISVRFAELPMLAFVFFVVSLTYLLLYFDGIEKRRA